MSNVRYVAIDDSLPALRALIAQILENRPDRIIVVPKSVRDRVASRDCTVVAKELPNGSLVIKLESKQ